MTPNEEQDLIKKVAEICDIEHENRANAFRYKLGTGWFCIWDEPLANDDPFRLSVLADFAAAWAWEKHEIWLSLGLGNVEPLRFSKSLGAWVKMNSKRNSFKRSDPHSKNLAILKAFIEAMEVIDDA